MKNFTISSIAELCIKCFPTTQLGRLFLSAGQHCSQLLRPRWQNLDCLAPNHSRVHSSCSGTAPHNLRCHKNSDSKSTTSWWLYNVTQQLQERRRSQQQEGMWSFLLVKRQVAARHLQARRSIFSPRPLTKMMTNMQREKCREKKEKWRQMQRNADSYERYREIHRNSVKCREIQTNL